MHRRQWICPHGCTRDLPSKADIVQHLLAEHSSDVDNHQASIYADMCEREMDDTRMDACLICLEEMTLSQLYEHLAMHMEEIALFVVPTNPNDQEDGEIQETVREKSQNAGDTDFFSAVKMQEDTVTAAIDTPGTEYPLPQARAKPQIGMESKMIWDSLDIERIWPYVLKGLYRLLGPDMSTILPRGRDSSVRPGWEVEMKLWQQEQMQEQAAADEKAALERRLRHEQREKHGTEYKLYREVLLRIAAASAKMPEVFLKAIAGTEKISEQQPPASPADLYGYLELD